MADHAPIRPPNGINVPRIHRRLTALLLTIGVAFAVLTGPSAEPAAAAAVARQITFPVGGPSHYIDDFGAPRVGHLHQGNDIIADKMVALIAAHDGYVSWMRIQGAGYPNAGNLVILRDDEGWEYWYIHINNDWPGTDDQSNPDEWNVRPGITPGKRVFAGEQIGYVGDSGDAETTVSHLHFEIHQPDGTAISPFESLNSASRALLDPGRAAANTPFGTLDAVSAGSGGVTMAGWAVDPNVAGAVPIAVFDNGRRLPDLTADKSRPDVGNAFPSAGANRGFDDRLALADGPHSLCAYALNDGGGGSPLLGCGWVNVTGSPTGNLDALRREPAGVRVAGWSIDPDAAGPVDIRITIDATAPLLLSASGSRPDVGAAFPGAGPDHGFDTVLNLGAGSHRICVAALDRGSGSDRSFGCTDIVITSNPMGNLDLVSPGAGGFAVAGWAFDPDSTDPTTLEVLLDNVKVQTIATTTPRPDVNGSFPGYPGNRGFATAIASGPGTHTVCVRGINVGPGATTTIGCRTALMTGVPFGSVDVATRGATTITVAGWVIDPDTANATDIHVYVDAAWGGAMRADRARPDVGAVFVAYGANHGYELTLDVAPGTHQVCVYGINAGVPNANPLLRCMTV
jgi:hypothetical protein